MYTQCPACETHFRISEEQLEQAEGKVRCSNCNSVFNAREALSEEPPKGVKVKRKLRVFSSRPLRFLSALIWFVLSLSMVALLLAQGAYSSRNGLAQRYPELRPYLENGCHLVKDALEPVTHALDCGFSMAVSLDKIVMENKDVRLHPKEEGALLINAVIINEAEAAQPFPRMQLTFSNSQDKIIARRAFMAEEYLSADTSIDEGMLPNKQYFIILEVVDPGAEAVNFEFNFI